MRPGNLIHIPVLILLAIIIAGLILAFHSASNKANTPITASVADSEVIRLENTLSTSTNSYEAAALCISILQTYYAEDFSVNTRKNLVRAILKIWNTSRPEIRHKLLLSAGSWSGIRHTDLIEPIVKKAINDPDEMIARDAFLIKAVCRNLSKDTPLLNINNTSDTVQDARLVAAARSGILLTTEEQKCSADMAFFLRTLTSFNSTSAIIFPETKDPIEERAYWSIPRWQIALEVEAAGNADIALNLLTSFDNHVRRAGILACGLLKTSDQRINTIARNDDDIGCRYYALLAKLMMTIPGDSERKSLIQAAIAMGNEDIVPAEDALFALMAAGASEGMDWLLQPLRPRRSLQDSPLGWTSDILHSDYNMATKSIWPMLTRFSGKALDIPPNQSQSERVVRLHADLLRIWWLLHRNNVPG